HWQEWCLDWINYRLWLDDDEVMKNIVNHYFNGLWYGKSSFHLKLLSLIRDDSHDDRIFYDHLPARHRMLIDQLATLPQWYGLAQMEAEREKLLALLKGVARLEGL